MARGDRVFLKVPVTPQLLRRIFDWLAINEKVQDGFYASRVSWQGHSIPRHLAPGSFSEMREYVNPEGRMFARVHQYRGPMNQPIGRPDPKVLRIDAVQFTAEGTAELDL